MSAILAAHALDFVWVTADPFLFCVHHLDAYPRGDGALGPAASLAGRRMGQDFDGIDGWRMYHGRKVPGFPQHPHRGFETVTVVSRGLADHADSLGATGRYGGGDTQWMTAGAGVVHSEMFPLVHEDKPNPLELFQIWLNLPQRSKMVPASYTMLWREQIPTLTTRDADGRTGLVTIVAGTLEGLTPPPPPPHSWAADSKNAVAIWTIALQSGARWTVPAGPEGTNRMLYVFEGAATVDGSDVKATPGPVGLRVKPTVALPLVAGPSGARLLLLQGRPIGEPVVKAGPFVMNSEQEIARAWYDYQRTGFGGWPWERDDPVHPALEGRFARRADGSVERPS